MPGLGSFLEVLPLLPLLSRPGGPAFVIIALSGQTLASVLMSSSEGLLPSITLKYATN